MLAFGVVERCAIMLRRGFCAQSSPAGTQQAEEPPQRSLKRSAFGWVRKRERTEQKIASEQVRGDGHWQRQSQGGIRHLAGE